MLSSDIVHINRGWLRLIYRLASMGRAFPCEVIWLKSLYQTGQIISRNKLNVIGNGKSFLPRWERFINRILPIKSARVAQVRDVLFYTDELTVISKEDFELLCLFCLLSGRVAKTLDPSVREEFCDAIHGFPDALMSQGVVGRRSFADSFFGRDACRLGLSLNEGEKEIIRKWIRSDPRSTVIDKLRNAFRSI